MPLSLTQISSCSWFYLWATFRHCANPLGFCFLLSVPAIQLDAPDHSQDRAGHRCSNAAHLYHQLTRSTLPLGAWTLTLRARLALSAACPCASDSANTPRFKPSTAMGVVLCST